ncbi:MAG TPA: ABC transporter ATP-binding protein [Thermoplasmata archaeon]|nr:ABC transporter ATP-binding protein [Thermoplasmata archaeon]
MGEVITALGLRKSFGKVAAVKEVSLAVNPGEVLGLVGPNGCGKTTALRCITGIIKMDSGSVSLAGHDIIEDPIPARQALAFIPEIPNPFIYLTVWEHLLFTARAYSLPSGWEAKAEALLRALDLTDKRDVMPLELSKGQKQKIHLAMAMLREPIALVLDEPLIGIDPKGVHLLKEWIRDRKRAGGGGIVSSHSLPLVEEVCERMAVMSKGRVVAIGTIEELKARAVGGKDATLEEAFLRIMEVTENRPE